MEQEIINAFTSRKYAPTHVQLHSKGMATVYLSSIAGVTAGTLYGRFADCGWIQVCGHGCLPQYGVFTVLVRVDDNPAVA